jgi:hypothetical protein
MNKRELVEEVRTMVSAAGLDVWTNVAKPWMSNRTPTDDDATKHPRVVYRLTALHTRLGGEWENRSQKKEQPLRFDLQVGDSTLLEVDTIRHFSSARLTSLDFYDEMDHLLDLERYRELCEKHRDEADNTMRFRQSGDFPFAGGRKAQAAFFDTAKDLITPPNGFRLIRLPVPEGEITELTSLTLRVML